MDRPVITRFAPSPTGFLHIGGARTALFNWLLSRKTGGKMLLRIEDTDRARSTDAATDAILNGLTWLGLGWDEDVVSQYSRGDRHREIAEKLLAEGKAYRCYATSEELAEMRETARAEGRPPRYDGRWRDRDPSEAPEGVKPSVRIKAPQQGETIIDDAVQGKVRFPNETLDDLIILRSDGSPTYMLAVVVDDHDMEVSHIIRGDDHLTNAARQTVIYEALGWDVPQMAHIPLIHGPDGAKLSKRHGALGVEGYRAMGYLPEALRNYLVRLGWAHGDEEYIPTDRMIELFSLDGINKGAARFDFQKLEALNGRYMREADSDWLTDFFFETLPHLAGGDVFAERLDETSRAQIRKAMPGLQERAKTLVELLDSCAFITAQRPLSFEEKAQKVLDADVRAMLGRLLPKLHQVEDWNAANAEAAVREFAEAEELKLGKVAQPLRAALTGRTVSPGVFDVLDVLGREESLGRIEDAAKGGGSQL